LVTVTCSVIPSARQTARQLINKLIVFLAVQKISRVKNCTGGKTNVLIGSLTFANSLFTGTDLSYCQKPKPVIVEKNLHEEFSIVGRLTRYQHRLLNPK